MNRLGAVLRSSRYHMVMTIIWVTLLIPTLIWWRDSVFWVAIMSWYANVVSQWAALQAARAEELAAAAKET